MKDTITESKVEWKIDRFASTEDFKSSHAYASTVVPGNILLNVGLNELWKLVCGTTGVSYDAGNSTLGVGDSTSPAAVGQTGLQASTNVAYGLMDNGYPTYGTDQTATWSTTFDATEANFHWQEFVLSNGTTALNRKVSDQGTKTSGEIWRLSLSITIA